MCVTCPHFIIFLGWQKTTFAIFAVSHDVFIESKQKCDEIKNTDTCACVAFRDSYYDSNIGYIEWPKRFVIFGSICRAYKNIILQFFVFVSTAWTRRTTTPTSTSTRTRTTCCIGRSGRRWARTRPRPTGCCARSVTCRSHGRRR